MCDFKTKLNQYVSLTEQALQSYLPEETQDSVTTAMRYSLLSGGKRLRASLVLEFCLSFGGSEQDALPFSSALEMIHAYSLIHDDLPCMDNDDMRRGKPSCHIAFGETTALLAGDGLLTKAFETAASAPVSSEQVVRAISVLSQAAGHHGMIGGQRMDLENESADVSIERIKETNLLKTGALICAAAELGCISAAAPQQAMLSAKEYARHIGTAFQITDDILDCIGTEESLGKPIGSDKQNDKTTYVSIFGIEKARKIAEQEIAAAKQAIACVEDQMQLPSRFLYDLADYVLTRTK